MKGNMLWRLLRRNISIGQLAGYAAANLVGLAIVLTAIKFYCDVTSVLNGDDSFVKRDYVIISKRVSGLGSLMGKEVSFSSEDKADLEAQPWVRRVGSFTAADFNVAASVEMGGRGMSTYLFFESIPSEFFDVCPEGWKFDPATDSTIPIIISKDYLTLYNFGFASSRGLPQISESMIGMIPLRVSLSGNGRQRWMDARIVGFSSRLNTIAVPEEFMRWANASFGEGNDDSPSRLIVEVSSPGDPAIGQYLERHGYEAAGDKADSGKASYFLSVATAVVIAVGAVISVLSFFVLLLSIWLLLQKNREKLQALMRLGYSPGQVSRCYWILVGCINGAVLAGAVAAMLAASHGWSGALESLGVEQGSVWPAIVTGVAVMALITSGNFIAISHSVRRNFYRS